MMRFHAYLCTKISAQQVKFANQINEVAVIFVHRVNPMGIMNIFIAHFQFFQYYTNKGQMDENHMLVITLPFVTKPRYSVKKNLMLGGS